VGSFPAIKNVAALGIEKRYDVPKAGVERKKINLSLTKEGKRVRDRKKAHRGRLLEGSYANVAVKGCPARREPKGKWLRRRRGGRRKKPRNLWTNDKERGRA